MPSGKATTLPFRYSSITVILRAAAGAAKAGNSCRDTQAFDGNDVASPYVVSADGKLPSMTTARNLLGKVRA